MTGTPTLTAPSDAREQATRRRWGPFVVLAVVVALAAGGVGWWIGSGASGDGSEAVDVPPIVDRYVEAMTSGNAEALAAVLTEDGALGHLCEGGSGPAVWAEGAALRFEPWFRYFTVTDMTPETVIVEEDIVAIAWQWSGTTSTHARAASDQTPFTAPVITIMTVEDGLIARGDSYCVYEDIMN